MAGKAIRKFHPQATATLAMAQLGFKICTKSATGNHQTFTPPAGYIFKAIISVNGVGRIQAAWARIGRVSREYDNLSKDGSYTSAPLNTLKMILPKSGDAIFGRFDRLTVWKDTVGSNVGIYKCILAPINPARE